MPWQSWPHQIRIMVFNFLGSDTQSKWSGVVVLVFAVVFLIIGVQRSVEFQGYGFSKAKRRTLITFHLIGCVIFAIGFILLALDTNKAQNAMVGAVFASAMVLLFPIHIYIGVLRRIRLKAKQADEAR